MCVNLMMMKYPSMFPYLSYPRKLNEVQHKTTEQDFDVYNDVHPWPDKDFDQDTEIVIQQSLDYYITSQ